MSKTASISEFYNDRSVLVTGATGFLGKILIEKLLRSCPGIGNIYILLRSKKEKDVKSRLKELLQSKAYDKLKAENPHALSKIKALNGDITKPDFGLIASDIQLLSDEVSIVFHSAASVAFNEPLKDAVINNLLPIDYLLKLCRQMSSLVAIVHVSTAYSNCTRSVADEIIYPPPAPPRTIINMINNLNSDLMNKLTSTLIGDYPNTYVYTKHLAEALISEEHGNLPIAVVRPSIVGTAIKELYEGWIDNFNYSSSYIVSIGSGLTRNFFYRSNTRTDFVPVDMCINLIIAVAKETALNKSKQVKVYHSTTGSINPLKSHVYVKHALGTFHKHPFNKMIRAPSYVNQHKTEFTYSLYMMWEYITFIYPYEFFLKLFGKKYRLKNRFLRYWNLIGVANYFNLNEWIFNNNNVLDLWNGSTEEDRQTFNFDVRQIKWPEYLEKSVLGCKLYLLNEDISSMPSAKRNYNRLYWFHNFIKYAKWIAIIYLFAAWKLPALNIQLVNSYSKTITDLVKQRI